MRLRRYSNKLFALPSDTTSLNQKNILDITNTSAHDNQKPALVKPCIVNTPEVVKVKRLIQVNIGHGEGDTKWKGCAWKLLLFEILIKKIIFFSLFFFYFTIIWIIDLKFYLLNSIQYQE